MKHSILSVWLFCASVASAQVPASTTIEINKLRTTVRADGGLFTNGSEGVFVPLQPGLAEKTLIQRSGIWVVGVDPAGNLKGAVSTNEQMDFQAGLPAPGDWNKIWEVSCSDISQHLADLNDNGTVDAPNTQIFEFPGSGNPYFEQYHSFPMPPGQYLGGFADSKANNTYAPQEGDHPVVEVRYCPDAPIPAYQNWFAFNDNGNHPSGFGPGLQFEVHTQVFAFSTAAPSLFDNAVFVQYKLINRSTVALDSCFVGIYTDFAIGNPNDDFLGTIPDRDILYGYNGDPSDEGGFEGNVPVMVVDLMRGPSGKEGDALGLKHAMILEPQGNLSPLECFRLLTGHFPDGTPAPNGGIMYPDNPNGPNGDSEVSSGNAPGQRVGLASYGPFKILPGAANSFTVAYYYVNSPRATPLQNVQALFDQPDVLQHAFDNCFEYVDFACNLTSKAQWLAAPTGLAIYPNPAATFFNIESKGAPFSRIQLFDQLGRSLRQIELENPASAFMVPAHDLPSGTYYVRVGSSVLPLFIQR